MKTKILFAALALVLGGCDNAPARYIVHLNHPEFSDDDYQKAALDLIFRKIPHESVRTEYQRAAIHDAIAKLRPWAEQFDDDRMQAALKQWFDFYDQQADEEFKRNQQIPAEMDEYHKQMAEENARKRALLSLEKIPPLENGK